MGDLFEVTVWAFPAMLGWVQQDRFGPHGTPSGGGEWGVPPADHPRQPAGECGADPYLMAVPRVSRLARSVDVNEKPAACIWSDRSVLVTFS